jgi:hypothetical protein
MQEELAGLKVTIVDQFETYLSNSGISQSVGSVMQELGLYGLAGPVQEIKGILYAMLSRDTIKSITGKDPVSSLASLLGKGGSQKLDANGILTTGSLGAPRMLGGLAVGLGGMALSNTLANKTATNPNVSNDKAITSGILGILGSTASGVAGGALMGNVPGAIIGGVAGLTVGLVNYFSSQEQRKTNQLNSELDLQASRNSRLRNQAAGQVQTSSGDPVVDAINNMNDNLTGVLENNFDKSIKASFMLDTKTKTSTMN